MKKKVFSVCRLIIINLIITLLSYLVYIQFSNKIIKKVNDYKYYFILFFILFIVVFRLYSFLKDKFVNLMDYIILDFSIFSFLLLLYYSAIYYYFIILLCDYIYLGIRIVFLTMYSTLYKNEKNLFTIKEVTESILKKEKLPSHFLLDEEAVNYDFLNRGFQVNDLTKSIRDINFNGRFTIGVIGEWGHGKTTLINNCIYKLNSPQYLLFQFNPWMYGSTSKLFEAFFNQMPNEVFPHNIRNLKLIKAIVELITKHDYKIFDTMGIDELNNYKRILSTNLIRSGKKIVIIIDNLDRLNSDTLISLLGMIYNYFDIKNMVFILSYDQNAVNKILKDNGIKEGYLDKIVQKEIDVSIIDYASLSDKYVMTMSALTEYYLSDVLDQSNLEYLVGEVKKFALYLAKQQLSLRDFKRYLNSMILPYLQESPRLLNTIDYYIISYIHMFYPSSYKTIYQRKEDLLDNKIDSFIDEFDKPCHPLLNYIFINTNENAKAFSEVPDTSIDEKVISDSNFFYSYFTLAQNSRSTILNRIEDIVNSFKKNSISNKQWKAELKEVIQIAIDKNYIRKTFNYLTNYLLILDEEERSLFIKEFLTLYPFDNIDNKKIMNDLLTFLLQELFYSHKEENMKTIINGLDKAMSEQIIKEVNSILNISSANNIKVLSRLLEERKDFLKNED